VRRLKLFLKAGEVTNGSIPSPAQKAVEVLENWYYHFGIPLASWLF
jgi:hypothetical protein